VADASQPFEMENLVLETRGRLGQIDIVVFSAGTNTPDRALSRLLREDWPRSLDEMDERVEAKKGLMRSLK